MSSEPTTVILPLDLGAAAKYDQDLFPLTYHDGLGGNVGNVGRGSLLLTATLEEMAKIKELGIDLSNNGEFLYNTRVKYEALKAKREKLQNNRKTFNPLKAFLNYRAARMFRDATLALYFETKETSEKIQRKQKPMQTVPSADMHAVHNAAPEGAIVSGIAINLPGALDDDAMQTIFDAHNTINSHASNPFVDNLDVPQLDDKDEIMSLAATESLLSQSDTFGAGVGEDIETPGASSNLQQQTDTTNPSSPPIINQHINIYQHSVVSTNSNVKGLTVNRGSRNSGASVAQ